jgi:tetratricopeptide (TPR) repeat protein
MTFSGKVFLVLVLLLGCAAPRAVFAQQSSAAPQAPATPPAQKVIKDPAEYNAYIAALNTQDVAGRAAAMEAFVRQYPQSVVVTDALEQAMAAYQQAGNVAKVVDTAKRLLSLDPRNIRALAIVTAIDRSLAAQGGAAGPAALKEGCTSAQTGSQQLPSWQKPEGMTDADFEKLRNQMADIFNGAAGFCALQSKDFAGARASYEKAFRIDPTNLQDVYQLSIACLEMSPLDVNGFWYAAKSLNLAQGNDAAQKSIAAYAGAKYRKFHGSNDGWDALVVAASAQTSPPADFAKSIKPAPTPAELAVQAVKENDPATLSFSDWEYILGFRDASPENKQAADRVWKTVQEKQANGAVKLRIPGKVISATASIIQVAITDDNQQANRADLEVRLEAPLAPAQIPAPGTTINVTGVLTAYTPKPFLFTMEKASVSPATP